MSVERAKEDGPDLFQRPDSGSPLTFSSSKKQQFAKSQQFWERTATATEIKTQRCLDSRVGRGRDGERKQKRQRKGAPEEEERQKEGEREGHTPAQMNSQPFNTRQQQ